MISVDQYLNHWKANYGRVPVDVDLELTEVMRGAAAETVAKANALISEFGQDRDLTSGWRPVAVNARVPGAARLSNHTRCLAIDLDDPEGDLDQWCLDHLGVLKRLGLYLEHPSSTKGWCHVQTVPPKSGNRVFYP